MAAHLLSLCPGLCVAGRPPGVRGSAETQESAGSLAQSVGGAGLPVVSNIQHQLYLRHSSHDGTYEC